MTLCSRCGEPAVYFYRETPCCEPCLPIVRRARLNPAPTYELTEEEQERLVEEMTLLESRRAERVETNALVIEGNKIRFKTSKELAKATGNKFGAPRELLKALQDDPFDF